jgi:hypothetical protein
MHLDVLTLVAMGSFVTACAGTVLLVAWSQNRNTSVLALWGLANIVSALGIASLMLASAFGQPTWSLLGASLLALAPGLIWKAARSFDAKPAPVIFAFLGVAVVGSASSFPGMRAVTGSLSLIRRRLSSRCRPGHVDWQEGAAESTLADHHLDGSARHRLVNRSLWQPQWFARVGRDTSDSELVRPHSF